MTRAETLAKLLVAELRKEHEIDPVGAARTLQIVGEELAALHKPSLTERAEEGGR